MSKFEVKIKEVRKSKNLKQSDIAKMLNTTQQTVSDYANGIRTPSLERLVELAQILDVTLDELIEFRRIHKEYSKELNNTTRKSTIK